MVEPSTGNTPGTLQPETVSTKLPRRIAMRVQQPLREFCGPEGPDRRRWRGYSGANLPDEEPDAGNPHVRVREGRGGNPLAYSTALELMEGQVLGKKGVMISWTRKEPWQNEANFVRSGPATRAASEEVGLPTPYPRSGRGQAERLQVGVLRTWHGLGLGVPFQPMTHRQDADATSVPNAHVRLPWESRELTVDRVGAGH